jgi:hypothetical protein
MGKSYSSNLRNRVVALVEAGFPGGLRRAISGSVRVLQSN